MNMNKMVVYMVAGSHLYGLNSPESDMDYKGIYIPEKRDLILNQYKASISSSTGNDMSRNTNDDIDYEVFSLTRFIELALRGDTQAFDMLHCTQPITTSPYWDFLVNNRTKFYTRNLDAMGGYVASQANKYGVKGSRINALLEVIEYLTVFLGKELTYNTLNDIPDLPENKYVHHLVGEHENYYEVCGRKIQYSHKITNTIHFLTKMYNNYDARAKLAADNKGIDWKALSHALRAGYQARAIFKHGDFEYPLEETNFIASVKYGKLDFETEVRPSLDDLVDEVKLLNKTSTLPETNDKDYWNSWMYEVYCEVLGI